MQVSIVQCIYAHRAWSLRLAGLLVFLVAFALPAVRVGKSNSPFNPTFTGWECARIASTGIYEIARWPFVAHNGAATHDDDAMHFSDTLLLALSGLINPLVIAQFLSYAQRQRWIAQLLGAGTAVCMISTWVLFTWMHIWPLAGHALWVVGALMIVASNLLPIPMHVE